METYELTVIEPNAMDVITDFAGKGSVKLLSIVSPTRKSKSERRAFYLSAPLMSVEELKRYEEIKRWMKKLRRR